MTIEERIAFLEQEIAWLKEPNASTRSYYREAHDEIRASCRGKRGLEDYTFFERLIALAARTYKKKTGFGNRKNIEGLIKSEDSKKEFVELAKQILAVCDRF